MIDDDTSYVTLSEIIEWCCITFGGANHAFFTVSSLSKLYFQQMLEMHDPEIFVPIGVEAEKKINEMFPGERFFQKWSWDKIKNNKLIEIKLHDYLNKLKYPKQKSKITITPNNHDTYLLSLCKLGCISKENMSIFESVMDFEEIDFSKLPFNEILKLSRFSGLINNNRYLLVKGTRFKTFCYESSYFKIKPSIRAVLLIEDFNIEGFCAYWNLLSIFQFEASFYWIPKKFFIEKKEDIISLFLKGNEDIKKIDECGILGLNINKKNILDLLKDIFGFDIKIEKDENICIANIKIKNEHDINFYIITKHLNELFGNIEKFYGERDKINITFNDLYGILEFKKPNYLDQHEITYYVNDFSIPLFKPCKSINLNHKLGFVSGLIRISNEGLSFIRGGWIDRDDFIYLRLLDNITAIESIFADKKIRIKKSDKGKRAEYLLNLFELLYEIRFLSGKYILELIKKCNPYVTKKGSTRRIPNTEEAINYNRIRQILNISKLNYLNENYAKKIVNWFIRKHFLKPGIIVKCKNCYNSQWLQIDDIRQEIQCQGCFSKISIPMDNFNHLQLTYVINDLLGRSIEQGFLSHLFLLHYLTYENHDSYSNLTYYYPGIELYENDNCIGEIDLFIVSSRKKIACECKIGKDVSIEDIDKFIRLCEKIEADVIIFSNLYDFSTECIKNIKKRCKKTNLKIAIIQGKDLINQCELREPIKQRSINEGNEKTYHQIFSEQLLKLL